MADTSVETFMNIMRVNTLSYVSFSYSSTCRPFLLFSSCFLAIKHASAAMLKTNSSRGKNLSGGSIILTASSMFAGLVNNMQSHSSQLPDFALERVQLTVRLFHKVLHNPDTKFQSADSASKAAWVKFSTTPSHLYISLQRQFDGKNVGISAPKHGYPRQHDLPWFD